MKSTPGCYWPPKAVSREEGGREGREMSEIHLSLYDLLEHECVGVGVGVCVWG